MSVQSTLIEKRDEVLAIAAQHGALNVRVFGPVARGEAQAGSDLDLVVELEAGRTLFDVGGLAYDLAELLGYRVDIVTEGGLRGRFSDYVLRDAVALERIAAQETAAGGWRTCWRRSGVRRR